MSENKEKTNEITAAEEKTENTQAISTREIKQKISNLSPVKVARILLAAALALFLIGVWGRYHRPNTSPVIVPTDKDDAVDGDEASPEPTPLPVELTDPASITVLVNKTHALPAEYVPEKLVTPYVLSTSDVIKVSSKAADQLKKMVTKAEDNGIKLYLTSGYISYKTQDDYFSDRASMVGEAEANKVIAKAGFSEHQTGLAFDFSDEPSGTATTTAFAETEAGKWLMTHAHEYGFILRYPEGKEAITGYSYQPWHYRYVGKDVANAMYKISPDLTMEEYYNVD